MSSDKSNKRSSTKGERNDPDDSEKSIKLSNNRYLTVSEFKNRVRVDIREYYMTEDGERKPGKKGISLSMEEWRKIVDNMDNIEKMVKEINSDSD